MNHPDEQHERLFPEGQSALLRDCLTLVLGTVTGSLLCLAIANWCIGKLL